MVIGKYNEAIDLLDEAIEINVQIFGQNHPKVAIDKKQLANVYYEIGEFEKSKELLEYSFNIISICFGNLHPIYFNTLYDLICINYKLNNYSVVKNYSEKLFEVEYCEFYGKTFKMENIKKILENIDKTANIC